MIDKIKLLFKGQLAMLLAGKKENKNISHNPQAESVKACFGEPKAKKYDPTDFKI